MKTKTKIQPKEWTQTKSQMPDVGKKVLAFVWRDKTVCQAWWNGENYILVAADEQGCVQIYQVLPAAISHWRDMPELPEAANNVHAMVEHQLTATMH